MEILIAEDDAATRKGIELFLKNQGHTVTATDNGENALQLCLRKPPDLIISDVKMPRMTGLQLLSELKKQAIMIPVIIMTAFATVKDAVHAMRQGAEDYLTKPLNLEELSIKLNKIQRKIDLVQENQKLKKRLNQLEFPEIIGNSKAMEQVFRAINRVANDSEIPVMIYGESGTGKELVARAIHLRSTRAAQPFIPVNCAAIPEDLLESELFGYKRGAFTGAIADKKGFFQAANHGTLFLDEVGEMSPRMQAKLLRVLQEGKVQPLGEAHETELNVRVIGAANKNLRYMMEQSNFREDLFYRLNVMEITLPSLRERQSDIPLLIHHFVHQRIKEKNAEVGISKEVMERLQVYPWPGNVRELENLVRMLLVTCKGRTIQISDLPGKIRNQTEMKTSVVPAGKNYKRALQQMVEDFEKQFITENLTACDGNVSKTAGQIGLSRVALHKKIKKYGIQI